MRPAAASTTCSQLSTSSSMRRRERYEMRRSRTSRSAAAPSRGTPRASATASGTWSGVSTDASRTPNAPSGNAPRCGPRWQGRATSCLRHPVRSGTAAEPRRRARPGSPAGRRVRSADEGRSAGSSAPLAVRRPCAAGSSRGPGRRRHLGLRTQGGVLAQHPLVQRPQRDRRLETERLVEHVARAGVDSERVGLPPAAVERHHQQARERLQRRVVRDERLEVTDDLDGGDPARGRSGHVRCSAASLSSASRTASTAAHCSVLKSLSASPRHSARASS